MVAGEVVTYLAADRATRSAGRARTGAIGTDAARPCGSGSATGCDYGGWIRGGRAREVRSHKCSAPPPATPSPQGGRSTHSRFLSSASFRLIYELERTPFVTARADASGVRTIETSPDAPYCACTAACVGAGCCVMGCRPGNPCRNSRFRPNDSMHLSTCNSERLGNPRFCRCGFPSHSH